MKRQLIDIAGKGGDGSNYDNLIKGELQAYQNELLSTGTLRPDALSKLLDQQIYLHYVFSLLEHAILPRKDSAV